MTEFNNEPLWVGMDVDAELARYTEKDRRGGEDKTAPPSAPRRTSRRAGLRAAVSALGSSGAAPSSPLAA